MSDGDFARLMIRAVSQQAAETATALDPDVGDTGALADQFEAAGLDSLAKHDIDVRTNVDQGPRSKGGKW